MPATLYPPARYRPVANTSGAMVHPTRGLIPHVQVGNGSLFGWFNNPKSQASSHLWLSKAGAFEQYVPFDRRAWAQAAGNPFWISCECEGYDTEDYTAAQIRALGALLAWGVREFGWRAQLTDSPDGFGLGTHRMGGAAWGGHACPGDLRANRRPDILRAALNTLTPRPPEVDVPLTDADVDRVAKATVGYLQALVWDDPNPPHQPHVGAMLRRDYEMTGDALARVIALAAALDALETRVGTVETEVSRVGDHLGESGPLAVWTAGQVTELQTIRGELARLSAGGPVDLSPVLARLDGLQLGVIPQTTTVLIPPGGP